MYTLDSSARIIWVFIQVENKEESFCTEGSIVKIYHKLQSWARFKKPTKQAKKSPQTGHFQAVATIICSVINEPELL